MKFLTIAAAVAALVCVVSCQEVFECPFEGYFRDPEVCWAFYRCVPDATNEKLNAYRFECPNTTVFNEELNVCDHTGNIICDVPSNDDYQSSTQSNYLSRSHGSNFITSLLPNNESRPNYDRSPLNELAGGGGGRSSGGSSPTSPAPTASILQAVKLRGLQQQHQPQQQHQSSDVLMAVAGPLLNNENEFPSLGGRSFVGANSNHYTGGSGMALGTQAQHGSGSRSPYANLMKPTSEMGGATLGGGGQQTLGNYSKEFRIQNEDFPALPGSEPATQQQQQASQHNNTASCSVALAGASFDAQRQTTAPGIQTHPDGVVTEIPGQMLNDQFGMVGLLSSLRAIYSDQRVVSLTLGQDMTTLGLDLNSPDKTLYQNFGGPWSDAPLRTQDLEWTQVPQEYQVGAVLKEKLAGIKLNRCHEDTLFFLFYQSTQEVYQMAAAAELFSRDWRYQKYDKVWLTRSVRQATEQGRNFERGYYFVFDPYEWRKVQKEMKLEYQMLEERPKFPLGAAAQPPSGAIPPGAVPPSALSPGGSTLLPPQTQPS